MEQQVYLIYTLNKNNTIILKEDTLEEIDKLTVYFENKEKLIFLFKKEIEKLINTSENIYSGKIMIINKNKKLINVLYKKHKRLFYKLINDEKFLNYLEKNYTGTDIFYDDYIKYSIYSNKIIRKVCKIYKEEYHKTNQKTKTMGEM